jgi:hypothetical protein
MKTQTTHHEVERSGTQVEGQFSIKATSKAFDILSSGLYSDKIQAIVRELSCNAHDSHVAAGTPDLPIEIRLPTVLDATFYVKDYGLGLSHDDVMKLYTTYFESTKTNSDDFIGQLGLGSKSPFSYASAFIVESRYNGMKRIYSCFKNEINLPAITLMGEEETTEPNGVMVSLSVRREDVDKFHTAARKALMYFKPTPNIVGRTGFQPYRLVHTVTGSNWRIRDTEYYAGMTGPHVVQGFVAYPVDSHLLTENGLSGAASALASVDVDMFVDIGKVEVAASREALSYDKRTIVNLISAFEHAATEMRTTFQAEFDKCTTVWEMATLLDKLESSSSGKFAKIFKDMNTASPFQWQGKDVSTTINLKLNTTTNTTISRLSLSRSRKAQKIAVNGQWHPVNSTTKEFEFDLRTNTHVLIDSEAKGGNNALREYMGTLGQVAGRDATVILIRPISRTQYSQKEVDAIVKMLGNPATKLVKDLPQMKNVVRRSSTSVKRAAEEKLVFTGFPEATDYRGRREGVRRVFSRLTWDVQQIDMADGGFYVEIDRFTPVANGSVCIDHIDDIISSAKKLGLLDDDVQVVGLNEKEIAKAHKQSNEWIELFDYLRGEFEEANRDGEMFSRLVADAVFQEVGSGVREHLVKQWDRIETEIVDGTFKRGVQKLVDLQAAAGRYDTATVNKFIGSMRIGRQEDTRTTTMPREWQKVLGAYEMLSLITMSDYSNNWVKPVINYVNKIEQG